MGMFTNQCLCCTCKSELELWDGDSHSEIMRLKYILESVPKMRCSEASLDPLRGV